MGETFLGVILWAEKDGIRGCVGDTGGQSWLFREFVLSKTREQIAVYQGGWRPKVSMQTNPKTGRAYAVTESEIVEFSIEFFRSGGYKILSIAPATNVSTQDSETLNLVRERFEMARRAERKARYERRESAPSELGFRTRKYERV